ncbi:MAG: 23S rRNA pseudouridine(955/2504/2580) synthase RluC, partial [Enterobacteriaceae bacterium]
METINSIPAVRMLTVSADQAGQRIDNYLRTLLKGVPKSMLYRIIRKGEVRVNKKRIQPEYRLQEGDEVRVPPVRTAQRSEIPISARLNQVAQLEQCVLYEDECLLLLNKPSGMAVHGGSGVSFGVIEGLRALRPEARFLELVHRLDRDTSGVLLIAKKRSALRALHEQLRLHQVHKEYLTLVQGEWPARCQVVRAPLLKNILQSGERMVKVSTEGKSAETRFQIVERFGGATLVRAMPLTGR